MGSRKQKILAVVLIALVVIGAAVGAAFGYLSAQTGPVQNTFTTDQKTDPTIVETFANNVKSNVAVDVGNPGYAVYVRAAIVVTWEDGSNNVLPQMPVAGTDYKISLKTGTADPWFYNPDDGFYYHRTMVDSGKKTEVLIESCSQSAAAPDGYQLHVEIIAQTIQALGTTDSGNVPAVTDAWGIRVDGNKVLYNTAIVQSGDNLTQIAKANDTTIAAIMAIEENGITDANKIIVGQVIYLPNVSKSS